MANKSRPKKTRGAFYKKYVYGAVEIDDENDYQNEITAYSDSANDEQIKAKHLQIQKLDPNLSLDSSSIGNSLKLPLELILLILQFTPKPYCTNHLLICRAIYWSCLQNIYEYPKLVSQNLLEFLDVISGDDAAYIRRPEQSTDPPKNLKLVMKRKFQNMVKCLDLTNVVQSGKNSLMSKLLRRTSGSIEIFISSQSSFGSAPLVSIKSCNKLKVLDLRLVSESVNLVELFKAIESLPELEQLCFPRSSVTCDEFDFNWPKRLTYLRLQGGVTDKFARSVRFPGTITNLEFAHCPHLTKVGLNNILSNIGINLLNLSITYPMPLIGDDGADYSFYYCPNLINYHIDLSYISWELFSEDLLILLEEYDRPLKNIIIESASYMGMCEKLTPNDITIAVDENRLPSLKRLGLSSMLGWDFRSDDMDDMVNVLDYHNIEVFKL